MENSAKYWEIAFAVFATLLCAAGMASIIYIGGTEHLGGILFLCLLLAFCWHAFIKSVRQEKMMTSNNI